MSEERLRRVVAQPAGRSLWANDLAAFFAGWPAEVARWITVRLRIEIIP